MLPMVIQRAQNKSRYYHKCIRIYDVFFSKHVKTDVLYVVVVEHA